MSPMEQGKKEKKPSGAEKDSTWDILLSLFVMIKTSGKWWLLPLLIFLAFLSIFVRLSTSSSVLPAIYALF